MKHRFAAAAAALLVMSGCAAPMPEAPTSGDTVPAETTTALETTDTVTSAAPQTEAPAAALEENATEGTVPTEDTVSPDATEIQEASPSANDGYRAAYIEKLTELYEEMLREEVVPLYQFKYSLRDVGGDDTPELFVSNGEYHFACVDIYAYIGGKVEKVTEMGSYGYLWYMPGRKQLYGVAGGMGSSMYELVDFDGEKENLLLHTESYEGIDYENEGSDEFIYKYYINDEEVTEEEHKKVQEENFSGYSVTLGRSYPLNEHGIKAGLGGLDADDSIDEMVLALTTEENWDLPESMATPDLNGDGERDLIVYNGYEFQVYMYDGYLRHIGELPPYCWPEEIFSVDYDKIVTTDEYPKYTVYLSPEDKSLMWRSETTNLITNISKIEGDILFPQYHCDLYNLKDGSVIYAVGSEQADKSAYDKIVDEFFAKDPIEIEFSPLAVG